MGGIEDRVRVLSTRELADAIGVSESSLKRWIDAGKIAATRTEGGHRRIAMAEALRFIRERKAPIVRPEMLDVPEIAVARARGERLVTYLLEGDHVAARGYLLGRFLDGARVAELADGPVRDAMHVLGELWLHDVAGIATEHRATDVCLQAVASLRGVVPPAPDRAPVAVGGAPAADPYLLPSMLASLTVQEAGMHAVNLGPDTPVAALDAAVTAHRAALVWLSISTPPTVEQRRKLAVWLSGLPRRVIAVVGGQQAHALGPLPTRVLRVASMAQLADVAANAALAGAS